MATYLIMNGGLLGGTASTITGTDSDWVVANASAPSDITGIIEADGDVFIFDETNNGSAATSYSMDGSIVTWNFSAILNTRYAAGGDGVVLTKASGTAIFDLNPTNVAELIINDVTVDCSNLTNAGLRSEERRVGKECRAGWVRDNYREEHSA